MKKIMIQGTMSGAGKSLLVTALCRIFRQDGYRVAPFKSQNMALNSFVTKEGYEIGRAQAVQAFAAGKAPEIRMNPVLLKPTGEMTSQVMVMGFSHGLMNAREYHEYKPRLKDLIKTAFSELCEENDIVVIEGAGSCAEINLKENDIVNMGLADMLDAPVLLAGDIDRGGVFAQLLGCVEWMTPRERELLKGFIINKFRGDVSLLTPGIQMLTDRCGFPTLGVVPYTVADIEDEDSLSPRLTNPCAGREIPAGTGNAQGDGAKAKVKGAVIKLPTISNFTDFNIFESQRDMSLSYVTDAAALDDADVIFIPGSKNTAEAKRWMDEKGISAMIKKKAEQGTVIFGICGGLQILGRTILDPEYNGSEEVTGLSLLPIETRYESTKKTKTVSGRINKLTGVLKNLSGMPIEGYEIHMGRSTLGGSEDIPILIEKDNIYATYVHGIFDHTAHEVVRALCEKKGLKYTGEATPFHTYREKQFDIIAESVRKALDMDRIYKIIAG